MGGNPLRYQSQGGMTKAEMYIRPSINFTNSFVNFYKKRDWCVLLVYLHSSLESASIPKSADCGIHLLGFLSQGLEFCVSNALYVLFNFMVV